MSDTKNQGDKTLHVSPKTLTLKRPVEQGVVRQSFSHGRTKAVVVETVKRRVIGPGGAAPGTTKEAAPAPAATPQAASPPPAAKPKSPSGPRGKQASSAQRSGVGFPIMNGMHA